MDFLAIFYLPLEPDQLKKSNYLSLKYNDKVAGSIVKRISLAGFTKCYNLIKSAVQSAAPTIQIS